MRRRKKLANQPKPSGTDVDWAEPQLDSSDDVEKNVYNLRSILLHSNANPFLNFFKSSCCFCTKKFKLPANLKKHCIEEHNSDALITSRAEKMFKDLVKLDTTKLNCNLCCTDIDTLHNLMKHLKAIHNLPVFPDATNFIVPFKFDTEKLICALCSFEFSSFKLLLDHMQTHYRNYVCKICSAGFIHTNGYLKHFKRHGEFKCPQCDKVFTRHEYRQNHYKRIHLSIKPRRCRFCDQRFDDYWKRMAHMVEKHGLPPTTVTCKACEKTFDDPGKLGVHMKKDHLMERRHKCTECEMSFFTASLLKKHMPKHSDLKKFKCDVCKKAYARKHTLREHMRIHVNDRRFACQICGQAFVQKCSWRLHMKSKHDEVV